jgi:hypothetical protein
MHIQEEYPKAERQSLKELERALAQVSAPTEVRDFLVQVMTDMEARARDLLEITGRLARPGLRHQELKDLLIAFQLTGESLRASSDALGDRLYELADRELDSGAADSAIGA